MFANQDASHIRPFLEVIIDPCDSEVGAVMSPPPHPPPTSSHCSKGGTSWPVSHPPPLPLPPLILLSYGLIHSFFVSPVYSTDITWQISIVRPRALCNLSCQREYSAISPLRITRGDQHVCLALINCKQDFIRTTHITRTFNLSPLTPGTFTS